jgi:hypothetical protein
LRNTLVVFKITYCSRNITCLWNTYLWNTWQETWRNDATWLVLARTIYIRCIYSIFGREITKYTVIYGVNIRFWPTLHMIILQVQALYFLLTLCIPRITLPGTNCTASPLSPFFRFLHHYLSCLHWTSNPDRRAWPLIYY